MHRPHVTSLIQNHFKSRFIVLKTQDDDVQHEPGVRRYRALFVSDLHLGTKACQAEAFLDFLRCHDASCIYLIGDIVDFWDVRRGAIWPRSHNDIVQAFLNKMRNGTRIVLIPGSHDQGLRDYCGFYLSGVEIVRDCIHETAAGQLMLVTHGDEFDGVVRHGRWLAYLGG
ncbi:MAG TPA: metallophosphoesterase, partial [Methyloceanibacter sp.]|nr:metallophosphoesterase [Methyloceanibacter sp.]